jgi:oligopeptide/dipeptide ABC transporter ATP-binding protein
MTPPHWHHLLEARGLTHTYEKDARVLRDVSLTLDRGETLGIVGESGSGKSTLGKVLLRLIEPQAGVIFLEGIDFRSLSGIKLRTYRQKMQMVFQNPADSLNPKKRVLDIVVDPIVAHGLAKTKDRWELGASLCLEAGLKESLLQRFPHELSYGERQRVAIARALGTSPAILVCDEPLASLDPTNQTKLLSLFAELRHRRELAYVFISHDLAATQTFAHRVAVMYAGEMVEEGPTASVFSEPKHPYTRALLDAAGYHPVGQSPILLPGEPPSPSLLPRGCPFHPRCHAARKPCTQETPPQLPRSGGGMYRCIL